MERRDGDDGEPFGARVDEASTGDDGDGAGVPALLILVGAGLFVFPEPVTSWVGATLIVIGALAWFVDAALN